MMCHPGRMVRGARPILPLVLVVVASAGACANQPPAPRPASPPTTSPPVQQAPRPPETTSTPTSRPSVAWRVGARPLPLRPDGFGQVLPTPAALRNRRLSTIDRLPPPPGNRFKAAVRPIGPAVRARMGATWSPACPVPLAVLRYVTVSFVGFDGRPHTGELVVHQRVADQLVSVFALLHQARFPIEEMRLVTTADLRAPPTGDGNNTAAFVCRRARKQTRWSAHAYGLAVDLNPFQNPYRRGDLVLPELASSYLDRDRVRPGMIRAGDVATKAFAAIGWTWGGTWRSPTDHMHFSATGR
jgi:D-alanyl-D-alanine carboxypeptidase